MDSLLTIVKHKSLAHAIRQGEQPQGYLTLLKALNKMEESEARRWWAQHIGPHPYPLGKTHDKK